MDTGVLYQNRIRNFLRSLGYPIGPPSIIYEDNQAKIKRVLADIITTQDRPLDAMITAIHEIHIQKTFEMVNTRSNMQIYGLNSNPRGRKILSNIIDHSI